MDCGSSKSEYIGLDGAAEGGSAYSQLRTRGVVRLRLRVDRGFSLQRLLAGKKFHSMASGEPNRSSPQGGRGNGARVSPGQLQTQNIDRNPRYSYMHTPVEMQRPVFQQFSSPTNSTIDESPISPATYSTATYATLPIILREEDYPYPVEKAPIERAGSPYDFPPPQEVHPAHFAPYAEPSPIVQRQEPVFPRQISSPDQVYVKPPDIPAARESTSQPSRSIAQSPAPSSTPAPYPVQQQSKEKPTVIAPDSNPRQPTYNPQSIAGPNGPATTFENHRPGQVLHPNSVVDPEWKHGLCEFDITCCTGLFCPCIVYGRTQYRLSRKAQKKDPTDLLGYETCNGSCTFMTLACGFQWIFATIQRTRIRKMYHLNGSFGSDCLKSLCCCCCVIMQDEREVKEREELISNFAGPASAYVTPDGMRYAPPPR